MNLKFWGIKCWIILDKWYVFECGGIKWNNKFVICRIKESGFVLVGFWLM